MYVVPFAVRITEGPHWLLVVISTYQAYCTVEEPMDGSRLVSSRSTIPFGQAAQLGTCIAPPELLFGSWL